MTSFDVVVPFCFCCYLVRSWCVLYLLALALFVARVFADNHDATVATNNFALVANLLNARVYLHVSYFFLRVIANRLFVAIDNAATS